MTRMIEITAEEREPITVRLVGKDYLLTPPKGSLGLTLAGRAKELEGSGDVAAIWAEVMGWLTSAVGAKQAGKIQARLDNPDDLLDITHVLTLLERVVESVTNTPTSSPSA